MMDYEYDIDTTPPSIQPLSLSNGFFPPDNGQDYKGVFCFLRPTSRTAIASVLNAQAMNNHPVRQHPVSTNPEGNTTLCEGDSKEPMEIDIALKYSPGPKDPVVGFVFGRSRFRCDVLLGNQSDLSGRRISSMHFRIYVNSKGDVMLEDTSMNGTWVDEKRLYKGGPDGQKRALGSGSVIFLCPGPPEDLIQFIVHIPKFSGAGFGGLSKKATSSPKSSMKSSFLAPRSVLPNFATFQIRGDPATPVVQSARQYNAAAIRRSFPFGQGLLHNQHIEPEPACGLGRDTHTTGRAQDDKHNILPSQVEKMRICDS